jgi:hypothetical protein
VVCRAVADAGGHRRDWLLAVAAAEERSGLTAVLAAAGRAGTRPAVWLVLRRALRSSGRPLPPELSGGGVWRVVARCADRLTPPHDAAPVGALVRVLAETCRATPAESLTALVRAATGAWRPLGSARDPAVQADRTC